MDPTFKKQWIVALRSGEYEQTDGVLRSRDGRYCCMGVAANLLNPEGWQERSMTDDASYQQCIGFQNSSDIKVTSGSLEDETLVSLGLTYGQQETLIAKNDAGETFLDIADYIEKEL